MHNTNRNFCKHTTGSNPNLLDASMKGGTRAHLKLRYPVVIKNWGFDQWNVCNFL